MIVVTLQKTHQKKPPQNTAPRHQRHAPSSVSQRCSCSSTARRRRRACRALVLGPWRVAEGKFTLSLDGENHETSRNSVFFWNMFFWENISAKCLIWLADMRFLSRQQQHLKFFFPTNSEGGILSGKIGFNQIERGFARHQDASTNGCGIEATWSNHHQSNLMLKYALESQKNMQTGQQRLATVDSWTTVFVSDKPKSILQGNRFLIWLNSNFSMVIPMVTLSYIPFFQSSKYAATIRNPSPSDPNGSPPWVPPVQDTPRPHPKRRIPLRPHRSVPPVGYPSPKGKKVEDLHGDNVDFCGFLWIYDIYVI